MVTKTATPITSTPMRYFRITAYAAAGWAFAFAAINFYWGVGGALGLNTLGEGMAEQALAGDTLLLTLNWVSVVGKVAIGLMALAFVRWHDQPRLGRLLQLAIWGVGLLATLYGAGNMVQHVLMLAGILPIAALLGSTTAVLYHLLIWDPIWLLGGVLFILMAWRYGRLKQSAHISAV